MSSTNPDSYERERLGAKFWIGLVAAAIACGVGAIIAFALFGFAFSWVLDEIERWLLPWKSRG